jgi:hypothetical protein
MRRKLESKLRSTFVVLFFFSCFGIVFFLAQPLKPLRRNEHALNVTLIDIACSPNMVNEYFRHDRFAALAPTESLPLALFDQAPIDHKAS